MRESKDNFLSRVTRVLSLAFVCGVLALVCGANAKAQAQGTKTKGVNAYAEGVQEPLYREYRGVRLGMTTEEARAKLGEPALKGDDQDFYVFSRNETAQIAYDAGHKVVTISIDYTGGIGAPDYRTVVGTDLQVRPDGSAYKLVRYEREGYWVSYNKSVGAVPVVTITLQLKVK
jgi:hypothetical protein